jgi:hypothetical protein
LAAAGVGLAVSGLLLVGAVNPGTTDLDGVIELDGFWVGPNESVDLRPSRVHNTDEGADWAEVAVSARNDTVV